MRLWKSHSFTSFCSVESCHRPCSGPGNRKRPGMQGCEDGKQALAWLLCSSTACLWLLTSGRKQQGETSPHRCTSAAEGEDEQMRSLELSQSSPFYLFLFFSPPAKATPGLYQIRNAQKSKCKSTSRFYSEVMPGSLGTSSFVSNPSLSLSIFLD